MTTRNAGPGRTTAPKKTEAPPLLTMREILDTKKPNVEEFPICLDSRLADARDLAERTHREAEALAKALPNSVEAQERLAVTEKELGAARAAAECATRTFVFQAVGRKTIEDLEKRYPASKAQIDAYRLECKRLGRPANDPPTFDVDTLPPVLLSLTVVDPAMTLEEARELWDSDAFSKGELATLMRAAWTVNSLVK